MVMWSPWTVSSVRAMTGAKRWQRRGESPDPPERRPPGAGSPPPPGTSKQAEMREREQPRRAKTASSGWWPHAVRSGCVTTVCAPRRRTWAGYGASWRSGRCVPPRLVAPRPYDEFLTYLVERRRVSGGTQQQALSALRFAFDHGLGVPLPWVEVTPGAPPAPPPGGAFPYRSCGRSRAVAWGQAVGGNAAVRIRAAADGGVDASREGPRLRAQHVDRAERQGRQGSRHRTAAGPAQPVGGASSAREAIA